MSSNEPVKNECEMIYEMFHILHYGLEIKISNLDLKIKISNSQFNI